MRENGERHQADTRTVETARAPNGVYSKVNRVARPDDLNELFGRMYKYA